MEPLHLPHRAQFARRTRSRTRSRSASPASISRRSRRTTRSAATASPRSRRRWPRPARRVDAEEYAPINTTDFTAPAQRLFDALKDKPGRKIIWIIWAGGGDPLDKLADLDPGRYGIELSTGGNILPALAAYKRFPGLEGATYYYYDIPKNPVNDWLVAEHQKRFNAPPDFFTAGGFAAAMAIVTAVEKAKSTDSEKLIATMEGMEFDTPKGKMIFRKEDHQALQSMYAFKIKVDPNVAWGIPELTRELKIEDMDIPIRNKR